jgi:hypothetical protein
MPGPFNKKSECERIEWDQCMEDKDNGIKWDDRCKDINYAFTDACDEFAFVQDCIDNYSNSKPKPKLGVDILL